MLGAALALAAGCARRPVTPPTPPPPAAPRPRAGYERLVDSLAAVDASRLAGRRIVLDPGHGGSFPGAVGVEGLTEAEVNLGVALALRDLLTAHGANVLLTRDADRDFLTPADSTLRSDLNARSRITNAFAPDLFVSIHHNADARGAHDVNETQTYYKLGDDGPSLDVAQDVHRSLVRNVGIEANKVVPGNYAVLRGSEAPAILTETSYLSYPETEARLRRPEGRTLEAQAIFIGLARYFARAVPVVAGFRALADSGAMGDSVFANEGPTLEARIEGAFDDAEMQLDGVGVPATRTGATLRWTPSAPLAAGPHEALVRARRGGTGTSRWRRLRFEVLRPATRLVAEAWPDRVPADGGLLGVRVLALDRYALPVADSMVVRMRSENARDRWVNRAAGTRDAVAWNYVIPGPRSTTAPREMVVRIEAWRADSDSIARVPGPRLTTTLRVPWATPAQPGAQRTVFLERGDTTGHVPLAGALGTREPARRVRWLNRDGFARLPHETGGGTMPTLAGYRPVAGDADSTDIPARWVPLFGGALHGRRITLDPEGGGDDPAGTGPQGTRAANLNLETARILAAFLTAAGADVTLTRTGDYAVSEVDRVRTSEAFHADRFVRIGHRRAYVGYYFSSAVGKRWAQNTARELGRLGLREPVYGEDAAYPIQQTSCPALSIAPSRLDATEEARLLSAGVLRAEAYAMFVALAREWSNAPAWRVDTLTVTDAAGRPVPAAAVRLGDAIELETDERGQARFERTEPGAVALEVEDPRVRARGLLLDSGRGFLLTGPRGR